MPTLQILALICAAGVAPADCTPQTADTVISRSAASAIPTQCLEEGQAIVAGGALAGDLGPGAYLKIACVRRRG